MDNSVWDEDKLSKLKALWDEGLPITKIGNHLGVSRNASAGKAHRMGLPKRNSPISKSGDPRKNQKQSIEENVKELPLKIILRDVEWSRNRCCWPIGDPKLPGFSFCGISIVPGRPYCENHSNLAYTNTRES
jgi:GcrA cell cycle regulator